MMLRSSSTPILGSLLSSYSESPNHNHHSDFNSPKHLSKKLSIHHQTGHLNLITPSAHSNSSPINAEFVSENSRSTGFRRVQSDGNLEGLVSASSNGFDEFKHSLPMKKFPRKPNCSVLQPIPSFSEHGTGRYEEDEEEDDEGMNEVEGHTEMVRGEAISLKQSVVQMENTGLVNISEFEKENEYIPTKMHLAKGLGVTIGGGGGHGGYKTRSIGVDASDRASMEEYYRRMMEENPGNPLFSRNYAEFLYQSEDLKGAEEFYSRAILMDPRDAEILSQYAQLIWELHHDEESASSYFQRAVQAAPEDSHVLAAYAGFLWATEEGTDSDMHNTPTPLHYNSTLAAATNQVSGTIYA